MSYRVITFIIISCHIISPSHHLSSAQLSSAQLSSTQLSSAQLTSHNSISCCVVLCCVVSRGAARRGAVRYGTARNTACSSDMQCHRVLWGRRHRPREEGQRGPGRTGRAAAGFQRFKITAASRSKTARYGQPTNSDSGISGLRLSQILHSRGVGSWGIREFTRNPDAEILSLWIPSM